MLNLSCLLVYRGVAWWLWAKIVQNCLDDILEENRLHRVRKQKKSLLPTGGHHINFYTRPEDWAGSNQLIDISSNDVDRLLAEYDHPELFQFGSNEMVALCERLFTAVGNPVVSATNVWAVFTAMILKAKETGDTGHFDN